MESLLLQSLAQLNQWVCWHQSANDKTPLRIADGKNASSTNPSDWCDYSTALAFVTVNPDYGLGFVLTVNDPYSVIDLDPTTDTQVLANHAEIFNAFNSYAELSPSGRGCHIWVRGFVETRKFTEQKLEVYSHAHYMTVTFKPVRDVAIVDCQSQLTELIASIDAAKGKQNVPAAFESLPETNTGDELVTKILQSAQGDTFKTLYEGDWKTVYP
jgi:primase-polymerase (primpol)-like protein